MARIGCLLTKPFAVVGSTWLDCETELCTPYFPHPPEPLEDLTTRELRTFVILIDLMS